MSDLRLNLQNNEVDLISGDRHCVIRDSELVQKINAIAPQEIEAQGLIHNVENKPSIIIAIHSHYYDQLTPELKTFFASSLESPEAMREFIDIFSQLEGMNPTSRDDIWSIKNQAVFNPPFDTKGWELKIFKALVDGQVTTEDAALIFIIYFEERKSKPAYYSLIEAHMLADEHAKVYDSFNEQAKDFFSPTLESGEARLKFIELCKRLENIEVSDDQLKALREVDLQHPLFKEEDWDLYVLKGIIEDRISLNDAAHSLLYAECEAHYDNTEVIKLLTPNGQVDEGAFELLMAHMQFSDPSADAEKEPILDENAKQAFKNAIKRLDPADAQFFFVPYIPDVDSTNTTYSIANAFLGGKDTDDDLDLAIVPPQLLSTMMKVNFDEDAVTPRLVTGGLSSFERFYSTDMRDVFIPCLHLFTPKEVHDMGANGLGIYMHDIYYHIAVMCAYPKPIRELYVDLLNDTQPPQSAVEGILDFADPTYLTTRMHKQVPNHAELLLVTLGSAYQGMLTDVPSKEQGDPKRLAQVLYARRDQIEAATEGQLTFDQVIAFTERKDLKKTPWVEAFRAELIKLNTGE